MESVPVYANPYTAEEGARGAGIQAMTLDYGDAGEWKMKGWNILCGFM